MTEERVPAQVTREEAKHYILLTLDRFRVMTLHLADNKSRLPSTLNGNEGGLDLLYELEARDFYRNLMFLYTSDIFEVLSSEGLRELLLKCRELSDRFCLKVRIAEDIRVVEEDVIERFTSELTEVQVCVQVYILYCRLQYRLSSAQVYNSQNLLFRCYKQLFHR